MGVIKTVNLGLNQYVPSDPVRMEDFNEDNRKIDAAVGANPYVKLLDVTTQTEAANIELNLEGIDISQYLTLRLYNDTDNRQGATGIRLNKINSGYSHTSFYGTSAEPYIISNGSYADFDLGCNGITYIKTFLYSVTSGLNPKNLQTIDIVPSVMYGDYPAGTRFIIWGVKK